MKTAKDYLDEANAVVPKMSADDAIKQHGNSDAVFIDVRDSSAIAETGTIKGAQRIPRGMIEFAADETMETLYNPAMKKDADLYVICAAGGQAALAGKTLKDMGFSKVTNIGGISGWKDAGGAMED